MQAILTAIGKLRGCLRQIETLKPGGASEADIVWFLHTDFLCLSRCFWWVCLCPYLTMNADKLALLCNALSVKEMDGPVRTLDTALLNNSDKRLSLCLVGKLLTNKLINNEAFSNVMYSVWRVSEGVEIEWIKGNIFTFYFKNLEDQKCIILGSPWSFDRTMLVLEEPVGEGDIKTMSFNRMECWVQIHNIPLLCMTEEIGIFLGKMIGEVKGIDLEAAKEVGGRFIRVRVIIDVNEPLTKSIRVDLLGNRKITIMLLHYERLLDSYFKYGRLGHTLLDCSAEGDNREVTSKVNMSLNIWLHMGSPPKCFHFCNDRNDRSWGKPVRGGSSNRSFGDWWKGKKVPEGEAKAEERWMSNFPVGQGKLKGYDRTA
ncbi:hypothetical protein Ddye_029093 [Dipteronia dyeriana]|uniref:DUF4283 domain-containing protein n=1 Tax=Dipteronia dyeriana TaxID=168575 RepID=A0AAD9TE55_9ROSI|nr:hypothetical protein Ddye_029093 [Dipteronia dyeriana]